MESPKKKKLMLVGGGTGGHVVPVFELYEKLKAEKNISLLVIGGGGEIEDSFYGNLPEYRKISAGKMHRVFTWRNIIEFFKLVIGFFQSFFLLITDKPDLIFFKGGYVSLPIIFWAKALKRPYFVHESDIEIGITNTYAAKGARKVFVGYPLENYSNLDQQNMQYTGQLISQEFLAEEKYDFVIDKAKKTVLFLGGSQGSSNLNEAVFSLPQEAFDQLNIIHQTGSKGIEKAETLKVKSANYLPYAFLGFEGEKSLIKSAIDVADLVVTRAGATTIAEVANFRKPMILVPYKHAAADHQTKNTEMLLKAEAVLAISDDDLNGEKLFETIQEIIDNDAEKNKLVENCGKAVKTDGLDVVAQAIKKELGES